MLDLKPIAARLDVVPQRTIIVHGQARQQPDWQEAYHEAARDRAILLSEAERLSGAVEPVKAIARALNSLDHAEDCPRCCHDECGPDADEEAGWDCQQYEPREVCEPLACECGLTQQRELVDEALAAFGLLPTEA